MKTCPYCEAEITNNAKKCKHCWEIVINEPHKRLCPYCEGEVSDTAKKCKHCWEWLEDFDKKIQINEEKEGKKKTNTESKRKSEVKKQRTDADRNDQKRAWRRTFIMSRLAFFADILALGTIWWFAWEYEDTPFIKWIFIILGFCQFIKAIFTLIYTININIKRRHDLWVSWWYMILQCIPIVWNIADLYLFIVPWDLWDNKYWPTENLEKTVEDIEREKEEEKTRKKEWKLLWILLWILAILILVPLSYFMISHYFFK